MKQIDIDIATTESEPSKTIMIKGLPIHTTEPMVAIIELKFIYLFFDFNYMIIHVY